MNPAQEYMLFIYIYICYDMTRIQDWNIYIFHVLHVTGMYIYTYIYDMNPAQEHIYISYIYMCVI